MNNTLCKSHSALTTIPVGIIYLGHKLHADKQIDIKVSWVKRLFNKHFFEKRKKINENNNNI